MERTILRNLQILILLITFSASAQNYELGAGIVRSEDNLVGYTIEANFIIKTDQSREYLNNLIFGFSHSGYMSENRKIVNKEHIEADCNCSSEDLSLISAQSLSPLGAQKIKKETRTVGLTLGVEICKDCWMKRIYLLTGVTNLQHLTIINNEKRGEYRTMQIDAGVKYFIKYKNSFITPTFRFNPETITFSIGYSR